jgi:hypothetical protein
MIASPIFRQSLVDVSASIPRYTAVHTSAELAAPSAWVVVVLGFLRVPFTTGLGF